MLDGMSFEIRPESFTSAVAQTLIADVQREYVHRYGSEDITPVDPEEFTPPGGAFLVACLAGAPVGCGGWRCHDDTVAELKRMYVAPAVRGRGLSRHILAALEVSARAAGFSRLILETGSKQPEAIGLYRSAGYTPIPNFGVYRDAPGCVCFGKGLASGEVAAAS